MGKLHETMATVISRTQGLRGGSTEITQASDDLSKPTEQQAASLEETAAALDEITATAKKTADGALQARSVVAAAKSDAEQSAGNGRTGDRRRPRPSRGNRCAFRPDRTVQDRRIGSSRRATERAQAQPCASGSTEGSQASSAAAEALVRRRRRLQPTGGKSSEPATSPPDNIATGHK